jgi:hypothetical protein
VLRVSGAAGDDGARLRDGLSDPFPKFVMKKPGGEKNR